MKKIIKKTIKFLIIIIIGYFIYNNYDLIEEKTIYVYKKYLRTDTNKELIDNEYKKGIDYEYVKRNFNSTINNKEDIKNSIYTFLDSGWESYKLYCSADYLSCTSDFSDFIQNDMAMNHLNSYVHPYNSFLKINSKISEIGTIELTKESKYTNERIKLINSKVDEIYNKLYNSSNSDEQNIKIFHDYIINNTFYNTNYLDNPNSLENENSNSAYGVLFEGKAVCSGYTDIMAIFLNKMNIKNYIIKSESHTWNYVYVNNDWKHLDLTWDDPITQNGTNELSHDFFLIDTNKLLKLDNSKDHQFDTNIYIEAK